MNQPLEGYMLHSSSPLFILNTLSHETVNNLFNTQDLFTAHRPNPKEIWSHMLFIGEKKKGLFGEFMGDSVPMLPRCWFCANLSLECTMKRNHWIFNLLDSVGYGILQMDQTHKLLENKGFDLKVGKTKASHVRAFRTRVFLCVWWAGFSKSACVTPRY